MIRCSLHSDSKNDIRSLCARRTHGLKWPDALPTATAKTMLLQHVLAARATHSADVVKLQSKHAERQSERAQEYSVLEDLYKELLRFAAPYMPDASTRQHLHLPGCECQACTHFDVYG